MKHLFRGKEGQLVEIGLYSMKDVKNRPRDGFRCSLRMN